MMHRFFAEQDPKDDTLLRLTEEDARHALTVLRMKPGDRAEAVSGGQPWLAEIASADGKCVIMKKVSVLPSSEPALSVTLFQGIPKSDKMDWIVQKATEIGVVRVVPVLMERCVSRPAEKEFAKKLERWRKISREAGKQSGRCVLPEITNPVSLSGLFSLELPEACVVPWEEAEGFGPLAFHRSRPSLASLGIMIGPEGGITPEEIELLKSHGFIPITLGRRILRTETAGLAAVAALFGLYGEMERL